MEDIYIDNNLKYPLTQDEYREINTVWQFMRNFRNKFVDISQYRNYIINKMRCNYTPEEFLWYESIADKLFWNLRHKLKNMNDGKKSFTVHELKPYTNEYELTNLLKKSHYRSYINKLVLCDRVGKCVYIKEMEGSSDIFMKDHFNLLTMTILLSRKLYENTMGNSINKNRIKLPEYYHQLDYAFPNINCCVYNIGDEKLRIKRITKMYYGKDDRNWYKIIM